MTTADRADLLAARLRAAREAARAPDQTISRRPPGRDVASLGQESIWLADRTAPDPATYNVVQVIRIRGLLDADVLRLAIGIVMERHEVLRTRYEDDDGRPRPVLEDLDQVPVTTWVAGAADAAGRVRQALERARRLVAEPFDLRRQVPVRAHLLRVDDDDWFLALVIHHIAVDGWSYGVLWEELSAAYAALVGGAVPALRDLPIQYADFANWQRARITDVHLDRQVGYWRDRLAGLAPTEVPVDFSRTRETTSRGDRWDFGIPDELAARLRGLSARHGVTLFHTMLAGFTALLSRWSGSTDVGVGTLLAAREPAEVEPLVGFFGTTVVIRTDLSGDPALDRLLPTVRDAVADAHRHGDVPFERVVREIRPARDPARHPLFQVMFTVQDDETGTLHLPGCSAETVPVGTGTAKFDMEVIVTRAGQRLSGTVEYAAGLFRSGTIARLCDSYLRLLADAADHPERRVSELDILPGADRVRLRTAAADTAVAVPDLLVHELVERAAAAAPGAVAVRAGGREWTYAELDRYANRLAHLLRGRGVGPDTTVGVCLARTPELVAALLAVLKAGGGYLPVDPDHPAERIGYVLADGDARLLVTTTDLVAGGHLPAGAAALCLDREAGAIAGMPGGAPARTATPDNLAYLIHTSGSTGRPKGVMVPHRAVVNLCVAFTRMFELGPGDVVGAVTTHAFDISVADLLATLMTGATTVLVPRATATDGAALAALIDAERVTVLQTTPTTWRLLLDAGWRGAGLRAATTAEAVPPALCAELRTRVRRLWNLYGPTETTVWSTGWEVAGVDPDRPTPIGTPLPNTHVYLLDARGRPVPDGVIGEIVVGGAGVTRGYTGKPGATAERYRPDPFVPGQRVYHTGDLARRMPDGTIEYLGRSDSQVKIRGNRIELGEVEAVLTGFPPVAQAAVAVRGDGPDRHLVGYVVWRTGPVPAAEVRAHLRTLLPDAMLPTTLVTLARLPVTPNGKVDRAALPDPDGGADRPRHIAPRTPAERLVAGVFGEVLGRDRVGADDDFFQLGGHSLRGLQAVARLSAALDREVPLRTLFAHPTPAALAAALDGVRRGPAGAGPVRRRPPGTPAPLSLVQQRLWFLDRLHPGHTEYLVPSVLRLRGALSTDGLVAAVRAVARRHEVLGSRFGEHDGTAVLVPAGPADIEAVEVSTAADGESEVRAVVADLVRRPMDLAAGAPLRARIIRLAPGDHVAALVLHHAAIDAWSLRLLWRDIAATYRRVDARPDGASAPDGAPGTHGVPGPAAPPGPDYGDYAAWQQGDGLRVQGGHLEYWRERLADPPDAELPTDRPRPAEWTGRGAELTVGVPVEVADRVRGLGRGRGATTYMILLSAFELVLSWYTGSTDVMIGTPVAGRTRPEVEEIVGCFVNTIVLRGDLSGDPTFDDLVRRVRDRCVEDFARQDAPFERLVDQLTTGRDLSRNPLFQVMFRYEQHQDPPVDLPGVRVETVTVPAGGAKFDLNVVVADAGDGMRVTFEYAADLFDAATIATIGAVFRRTLGTAVTRPDMTLSRLAASVTGDPRAIRPLSRPAGGKAPDPARPPRGVPAVPQDGPGAAAGGAFTGLAERIAAQAARTPDRPALRFGGRTVGYGELDARANQVAGWLRRTGVGPGTLVAVALDRSPELVTTLLGVLRAGAAYLPLDPSAPPARLAALVDGAGAQALLTTGAALPAAALDVLATRTAVHRMDTLGDLLDAQPTTPPGVVTHPDGCLAVYHTSGSSGRPKGVATLHGGVANFLDHLTGTAGLRGDDTVLQVAAVTFDASIRDMFGPLTVGATVVLLPDHATRDPYALLDAIAAHRVTALLSLVPTTLLMLAAAAPDADAAPAPTLRLALLSGEPLTPEHVRAARRLSPGIRVANQYGPTECTMVATFHEVTGDAAPVPLGRPIRGMRAFVLGPSAEPLPPGALGELYLSGAGVSRGYVGAPAATAERFLPDPYGGPGARMYRTGDLARWRHDGTLIFHGRRDLQVKIRGVRVEVGEVEAALSGCPGVRAAAVAVRGGGADAYLAGYVVTDAGVEVAAVHAALRGLLPDHLVPSTLDELPALPRTPHGKLDRAALPAPAAPAHGRTTAAPRDRLELRMLRIWERILGRFPLGIRDNFFDNGGHSLRAVELVEELRRDLGVAVPLHAVFSHPTVERLAEVAGRPGGLADQLVVKLADGPGTGPPLILIHPQSGDVVCYTHLARALGAHGDVYGVEAVGYSTGVPPLESIEAMADRYVESVRAVEPHGPYLLAGWSFGGNVAFEMAVRLEAAGRRVGFLGVIDARAFGRDDLDRWFQRYGEVERYGMIAEVPPDDLAALATADEREAMAILLRAARGKDRVPQRADTDTLRRMVAVFTANGRAADRYATAAVVGTPIHLFKASERHPTLTNPVVDPGSWQGRTRGPVRVVPVPGNHHDLVYPPHAATLAREIGAALRSGRGW